jgi:hypothetical protein
MGNGNPQAMPSAGLEKDYHPPEREEETLLGNMPFPADCSRWVEEPTLQKEQKRGKECGRDRLAMKKIVSESGAKAKGPSNTDSARERELGEAIERAYRVYGPDISRLYSDYEDELVKRQRKK